LNRLGGTKYNILSSTEIPRRIMSIEMQVPKVEEVEERTLDACSIGATREGSSQSKILTHFIKGKISLSPMEHSCQFPAKWNIWKV
jgi:hypothetical protein